MKNTSDNPETIGAKLRSLRLRGGYTVVEVCRKVGMQANQWYAYESGSRLPTLLILLRLSRALRFSLAEFDDAACVFDNRYSEVKRLVQS